MNCSARIVVWGRPWPRLFVALLVAVGLTIGQPAAGQAQEPAPAAPQTVDFSRDIAPLLARNCVACHNAKKPEGGLNLESHAGLMAGGDSGAALDTAAPQDSYLLARVTDESDPMPPIDNAVGAKPLTAEQVELLQRWIAAGAANSQTLAPSDLAWQAIPSQLAPIYALATTPDGSYLAAGRGNTAQMIYLGAAAAASEPSGAATGPAPSAPLIDGGLQLPDGTALAASHLDLVQSLAVSPDSQWLASGGYRSVKLWQRQTTATTRLAGLPSESRLLAASPSGQHLAVATHASQLEVIDIGSGQAHRFLTAHAAPITALHWLSDQQLLSADASGGLVQVDVPQLRSHVWQLESPRQLVQLVSSPQRVYALDDQGHVVRLAGVWPSWLSESATGQTMTAEPYPLTTRATAIAFTAAPTPTLLVALSDQGLVRLAADGPVDQSPAGPPTPLPAAPVRIDISPDGQTLLAVAANGQVQLCNLTNGEVQATLDRDYEGSHRLAARQRDTRRQTGLLESLAAQLPALQKASQAEIEAQQKVQMARDEAAKAVAEKAAARTAAQGAVSETEQALAAAQQRVTELTAELEAKRKAAQESQSAQETAEAELAKRDQALASASDGVRRAAERITELEQRTATEQSHLDEMQSEVQRLEAAAQAPPATAATFVAQGQLAAVAGEDHQVRLYQVASGAPHATLRGTANPLVGVYAASPNHLHGLTRDGQLQVWDLALPWQLRHTLGSPQASPFSDRITALDFSPDGKLLAVGSGPPSRYGEVQLVDVATASVLRNLGEVHSDSVLCLRFSPDGRLLASGGADKLCRLWNVASGSALRSFEGHTHHVLGVAWQDNGQELATAGADLSVKIWKVDSGEQVRTISGFGHEVTAVQYIGDSPRLVGVSADGGAKILNSQDGKTLHNLSGASDALYAVSVSADGQLIMAGGQAGKIWSWNAEDGKLRDTIELNSQ